MRVARGSIPRSPLKPFFVFVFIVDVRRLLLVLLCFVLFCHGMACVGAPILHTAPQKDHTRVTVGARLLEGGHCLFQVSTPPLLFPLGRTIAVTCWAPIAYHSSLLCWADCPYGAKVWPRRRRSRAGRGSTDLGPGGAQKRAQ